MNGSHGKVAAGAGWRTAGSVSFHPATREIRILAGNLFLTICRLIRDHAITRGGLLRPEFHHIPGSPDEMWAAAFTGCTVLEPFRPGRAGLFGQGTISAGFARVRAGRACGSPIREPGGA